MSFSSLIMTAIGIAYLMTVVYLANREDATGQRSVALRWLLYGIVALLAIMGLSMMQLAALPDIGNDMDITIQPTTALVAGGVIWAIVVVLILLIRRQAQVLGGIYRICRPGGLYHPASTVHNTAVILAFALIAFSAGTFVLSGGLTGFAEDLQTNQLSPAEPVLTAALQIIIAFLGVGLLIRRSWPASLLRLGLVMPTQRDLMRGLGYGLGLFAILIVFASIWLNMTSPEQIEQQTQASQEFALQFNTLAFAFIGSLSAALGEEIFIRGALQPIFGLLPTSIFFVLLHTQYWITPGLLLILIISLGLGWIRRRYSTTTAIITHFTYNFIQLTLLIFTVPTGGT